MSNVRFQRCDDGDLRMETALNESDYEVFNVKIKAERNLYKNNAV